MKLKFGKGNAKLSTSIATFSLPAGFTCPGAKECKSQAVNTPEGVRIKDGPHTKFRCFAAQQEVMFPKTFSSRRRNLQLLRAHYKATMADLISSSLPSTQYVRVHVSGDFFSQKYFDAWMEVARQNPTVVFYAYTKSLPFWVARKKTIPSNFMLTASYGGRYDELIATHNLRHATVVFSEEEAQNLGLDIDHDDSHAMKNCGNFALLLHGVQPKGSEAAKALVQLKKKGIGGYSKGKARV